MLKRTLDFSIRNCNYLIFRDCSSAASAKWDLLAAVCVERKPIITPLLNDLQKNFKQYLQDVEYERSYKSDHEVRHERDLKQAELLKKGDTDVESSLKQTAQDFLDASVEEFNKFKPADRTTAADKSNDIKSLNRKLDKHLVLLTKQKIGDKEHYLLPQGVRQDGETMRQTADRIAKETFGDTLKVQIYGNAPAGLYKYRYPTAVRKDNGAVGAKVFFYFARYNGGSLSDKKVDYKWLDRNELGTELKGAYHSSVSQFLIDEN